MYQYHIFSTSYQIEDVLEQRLVDDAPSDEEDDEELQVCVKSYHIAITCYI